VLIAYQRLAPDAIAGNRLLAQSAASPAELTPTKWVDEPLSPQVRGQVPCLGCRSPDEKSFGTAWRCRGTRKLGPLPRPAWCGSLSAGVFAVIG